MGHQQLERTSPHLETPPQHRHAHRWPGGRLLHWEDLDSQVGWVVQHEAVSQCQGQPSAVVVQTDSGGSSEKKQIYHNLVDKDF